MVTSTESGAIHDDNQTSAAHDDNQTSAVHDDNQAAAIHDDNRSMSDSNAGRFPVSEVPGMDEAMQQRITEIVQQALNDASSNRQGRDDDGNNRVKPNWKDAKIGYFQPDHTYGKEMITTVGNDVYIRDVFLFIDRIRDAVALRSEDMVKARIPALLRGTALQWYASGLDDVEKSALRHTPGMQTWEKLLSKRFRTPITESLSSLANSSYSIDDARRGRPVEEYVFKIVRHARNAGLDQDEQQVTYAFNSMDARLRQSLWSPTDTTKVRHFIDECIAMRDTWGEVARMWSQQQPFRGTSVRPQFDGYNRPAVRPGFNPANTPAPPGYYGFCPDMRQPFVPRSFNPQANYQPQYTTQNPYTPYQSQAPQTSLPPPSNQENNDGKRPLRITDGALGTASSTPRSSPAPGGPGYLVRRFGTPTTGNGRYNQRYTPRSARAYYETSTEDLPDQEVYDEEAQ